MVFAKLGVSNAQELRQKENAEDWRRTCARIRAFVEAHGHSRVPEDNHDEDVPLDGLVGNIRLHHSGRSWLGEPPPPRESQMYGASTGRPTSTGSWAGRGSSTTRGAGRLEDHRGRRHAPACRDRASTPGSHAMRPVDSPRSPTGRIARPPARIDSEIEAQICELRREHPGWGPRRIRNQLAKLGVDPVPVARASTGACAATS